MAPHPFARRDVVAHQMCERYGSQAYHGGFITLTGGAARTEGESGRRRRMLNIYKPKIAASIVPMGINIRIESRNAYGVIDSAKFGHSVGPFWEIGVMVRISMGPIGGPFARSMRKRWGVDRWNAECTARDMKAGQLTIATRSIFRIWMWRFGIEKWGTDSA